MFSGQPEFSRQSCHFLAVFGALGIYTLAPELPRDHRCGYSAEVVQNHSPAITDNSLCGLQCDRHSHL